ncbi:MAG: hypothetical protein ACYCZV_09940, partial [Acidimicrobiales bacterium]
ALANASEAGVDVVVVTWIFATADQEALIRGLAPADVDVVTVHLSATEPVWRRRFESDPLRKPVTGVDIDRWATRAITADHVVSTDGMAASEVGRAVARLVL